MAGSRRKSLLLRGAFLAMVLAALLAAPGAIHGGLVYFHRQIEHRPPRIGPGFHVPLAMPGGEVPLATPGANVWVDGWSLEGFGGR